MDEDHGTRKGCHYFVAQKRRYCRMTVKEGQNFCGEHIDHSEIQLKKDDFSSNLGPTDDDQDWAPEHNKLGNFHVKDFISVNDSILTQVILELDKILGNPANGAANDEGDGVEKVELVSTQDAFAAVLVENAEILRRIPCPNDPKHSCYEKHLQKHLKKCNARQKENPDYIIPGINNGPAQTENKRTKSLAETEGEDLLQLIEKIKYISEDVIPIVDKEIYCHSVLADELKNPEYGPSTLKHRLQNASLIGHIEHSNLMQPDTCFIEFGAGRAIETVSRKALYHRGCDNQDKRLTWLDNTLLGTDGITEWTVADIGKTTPDRFARCDTSKENPGPNPYSKWHVSEDVVTSQLSFWLGQVACHNQHNLLLLIDKESHRHKFDKQLLLTSKVQVQRLRANIADLSLAHVPTIQEYSHWVGISKHLCGAATDLALRCFTTTCNRAISLGIIMAPCCHHKGDWNNYIGKEFLLAYGITAEEFWPMTGIASWATCGISNCMSRTAESDCKQSNRHVTLNLRPEEKEDIGRKCKQILDYGRLKYLESLGYRSKLVYYINEEISPENLCMVAVKD